MNEIHTPLLRDLDRMAQAEFDVLVIGGGVTGACVAWDAALRGLRVALVERDDFGGATSANSLKTVHGGLRYLRDGNLRLFRLMTGERKALLRIAPHLVHPLPVLMPTFEDKLRRSRWTLGIGAKLNDLLSIDRNWGQDQSQALPGSRLLSRSDCLQILPGLAETRVSGGIVWHDAKVHNTERLTLAFLRSAVGAGAQIANYAEVTGLTQTGRRVTGATLRDGLTGSTHTLRAKVVVNTAGPWVDEVLSGVSGSAPAQRFYPSLAMNIVTRQVFRDYAVGLPSVMTELHSNGAAGRLEQVLFVVPWRGYSIIGTRHSAVGAGALPQVTEDMLRGFLEQINAAYPSLRLKREDVCQVHAGYLPIIPGRDRGDSVSLIRESQIHDHAAQDGVGGLITVVGVKYTTARSAGERATDLAFRKLERPAPPCRTRHVPVYGGQPLREATAAEGDTADAARALPVESRRALGLNHGSQAHEVLQYAQSDPAWGRPLSADTHVLRAEVLHAVQVEMAWKLSDVALRRTELGSAGPPSEQALEACAAIMAAELDWDANRVRREVDEVWGYYAARGITTDPIGVAG